MKYKDLNKLEIGMPLESKEYGIGTINNIWTYRNKIYLSLKIEDLFYQYELSHKDDLKDLNFIKNKNNYHQQEIVKEETQEDLNFIKNKNNYYNQEIIEEETQEDLDFRLKYPMKFHCIDGHYVRSPYEQQIDDFLTEQNIIHYYEKRVKNYNTNETYYPDWYLPNITKKGVYIEFFDVNEENYKEKTERKLKFFKEQNLNLIILYQKHMKNYREYIIDKIEEYKK